MEIHASHALRQFKKEIGQANHMLITIMVGLDAILSHDVTVNSEFHTSWNPKSKQESVSRSKNYAKKATLAWLVDCIDMYFVLINTTPALVPDASLKKSLDNALNSRSVHRRLDEVAKYLNINSIEYALVDLLICWRNRLTHYNADNNITTSHRTLLLTHANDIACDHCGLNIQETLNSFDNGGFPTFKEVTSFVRASILFLTEVDHLLLNKLGQKNFADRILINYFSEDPKIRLNNIFSKTPQIALKSIRQVLVHNGFTCFVSNTGENEIDNFCIEISHLSRSEATIKLSKKSFL